MVHQFQGTQRTYVYVSPALYRKGRGNGKPLPRALTVASVRVGEGEERRLVFSGPFSRKFSLINTIFFTPCPRSLFDYLGIYSQAGEIGREGGQV